MDCWQKWWTLKHYIQPWVLQDGQGSGTAVISDPWYRISCYLPWRCWQDFFLLLEVSPNNLSTLAYRRWKLLTALVLADMESTSIIHSRHILSSLCQWYIILSTQYMSAAHSAFPISNVRSRIKSAVVKIKSTPVILECQIS